MLGFFSNGYDRVFLERLGDHAELGYYSVGVSMASYISVFQSAIGNTFQPDLFQAIAQRNRKQLTRVIVLLVGSNVGWLIYEAQFEVVEETTTETTVTQDNASGYNNYIENNGDIVNGETDNNN